jgi:hypothetical protein
LDANCVWIFIPKGSNQYHGSISRILTISTISKIILRDLSGTFWRMKFHWIFSGAWNFLGLSSSMIQQLPFCSISIIKISNLIPLVASGSLAYWSTRKFSNAETWKKKKYQRFLKTCLLSMYHDIWERFSFHQIRWNVTESSVFLYDYLISCKFLILHTLLHPMLCLADMSVLWYQFVITCFWLFLSLWTHRIHLLYQENCRVFHSPQLLHYHNRPMTLQYICIFVFSWLLINLFSCVILSFSLILI